MNRMTFRLRTNLGQGENRKGTKVAFLEFIAIFSGVGSQGVDCSTKKLNEEAISK